MRNINVMDVTLRDGGCVNDFNYGTSYMNAIVKSLAESRVDYIEVGYLDEKNGSERERTQFISECAVSEFLRDQKLCGCKFAAMMDYGKFTYERLPMCKDSELDAIRVAFHKEDYVEAINTIRNIINLGYEVFVQPMVISRYSESELCDLICCVNQNIPNAAGFYIVDSFGELRNADIIRLSSLIDDKLVGGMPIGIHGHDNLKLAYSNAIVLLNMDIKRDLFIDSSIMGIGKGAGNLNTELLMEHINIYVKNTYHVTSLLSAMDKVIRPMQARYSWGYSAEYYLSSKAHCSPSYASYFYGKHMLTIEQIEELLSQIEADKRKSFDREYAKNLYERYSNITNYSDESIVVKLAETFRNREVVLVAPGRTAKGFERKLEKWKCPVDAITIGLNLYDNQKFDYTVITRLECLDEANKSGNKIITTTKIAENSNDDLFLLNYERWVEKKNEIQDSSTVIILNLLLYCMPQKVYLIGFDGYDVDIDKNYSDQMMNFYLTPKQAEERNEFYKYFFNQLKNKGLVFEFVTKSLYEENNV